MSTSACCDIALRSDAQCIVRFVDVKCMFRRREGFVQRVDFRENCRETACGEQHGAAHLLAVRLSAGSLIKQADHACCCTTLFQVCCIQGGLVDCGPSLIVYTVEACCDAGPLFADAGTGELYCSSTDHKLLCELCRVVQQRIRAVLKHVMLRYVSLYFSKVLRAQCTVLLLGSGSSMYRIV